MKQFLFQSKSQNKKLANAFSKCSEILELMTDVNKFLDHLETELPSSKPVTQVSDYP